VLIQAGAARLVGQALQAAPQRVAFGQARRLFQAIDAEVVGIGVAEDAERGVGGTEEAAVLAGRRVGTIGDRIG
jgi:hypothetical protein